MCTNDFYQKSYCGVCCVQLMCEVKSITQMEKGKIIQQAAQGSPEDPHRAVHCNMVI